MGGFSQFGSLKENFRPLGYVRTSRPLRRMRPAAFITEFGISRAMDVMHMCKWCASLSGILYALILHKSKAGHAI